MDTGKGNPATSPSDFENLLAAYEQLEESISRKSRDVWQMGSTIILTWLSLTLILVVAVFSWSNAPWIGKLFLAGLSLTALTVCVAWICHSYRRRQKLLSHIEHELKLKNDFMTLAHEYRSMLLAEDPVACRVIDLRLARL